MRRRSTRSRRAFLTESLRTGLVGGLVVAGTRASARVLGANDRVRVGIAGINSMGRVHIENYAGMKDVEVAYLIDPDSRLFEPRVAPIEKAHGYRPQCVQDIRRALDDPNLDAVSTASCNHWHALITIWACQAGKDVYVEKPASHTIEEGRRMVEAARKYNRIVQHGTQRRAIDRYHRYMAAAQSGRYGKLLLTYAYSGKPRKSIGFAEPKQPPAELDFNIWLGPASRRPYHENLVHYNWHWFWDFGNGDIGNYGVHRIDLARWAIPGATLPRRVVSLGGRFGYEDQAQTPNTQLALYDYGETKLLFEERGLPSPGKPEVQCFFEEGRLSGSKFYPNKGKPERIDDVDYDCPPGGIFGNFIDCVRTRKSDNLAADVLEGHYSAGLAHLGNISYRLGKDVPFSTESRAFGDDKITARAMEEVFEHLKDQGVKLDDSTYRLGRRLEFDPAAERFVDCPEADALLRRPYREPFVVPDQV